MDLLVAVLWLSIQSEPLHPLRIEQCLEAPAIKEKFSADFKRNPYYLRGDFDADGQPDYAVAMTNSTGGASLLLCPARGAPVVMGGDPSVERALMAPHWSVASRSEILALRKQYPKLPIPVGEVITFTYEDGERYIYWDGKKYAISESYI